MIGSLISFVASVQIVLAASEGPPKVDMTKTCRASADAITSLFGDTTTATFEACMKQENSAFEQIRTDWTTYPAAGRGRCVQTTVYMPSYVEWLTCLEMEIHRAKIRMDEAAKSAAGRAQGKSQ